MHVTLSNINGLPAEMYCLYFITTLVHDGKQSSKANEPLSCQRTDSERATRLLNPFAITKINTPAFVDVDIFRTTVGVSVGR